MVNGLTTGAAAPSYNSPSHSVWYILIRVTDFYGRVMNRGRWS